MFHIIISDEDFIIKEKIIEISNNNFKIINSKDKDFLLNFQKEMNKKLWGGDSFLVIQDFQRGTTADLLLSFIANYNTNVIVMFDKKQDWLVKKLQILKISHKIHQIELKLKAKGNFGKTNFKKWAEETLKKYQIKLRPATFEKLCEIFAKSPSQFMSEIKKLSYYKTNQLITNEELKTLIRHPNESRMYDMIDYLKDRDFNNFFPYLKREIIFMEKPEKDILQILAFLGSTLYRILLVKKAKENDKLNEVDLNPYYKSKLLQASNKFSEKELKYLYNVIIGVERKYKKHQIKISDIADEFILRMSVINSQNLR